MLCLRMKPASSRSVREGRLHTACSMVDQCSAHQVICLEHDTLSCSLSPSALATGKADAIVWVT
jgi:hypothetical protein